jgi:chromosome segregation protein
MKLSRLELSGFKSFADSVRLQFYDGVSAVVGPNGCGKSNISDAVRWVLGEQRARLLRSSRMDEVIFQGSVKRKPINLAEVSLVFDNSEGLLPIAYREVVVTRRITRSGQSEYLLNQAPVRLRDISDLLQGTGLGSDAGVVIEAQMIDRLLSDRTEERRSLFEEAAGIGLYRNRKESTERRLERTTGDLQRLDDVISEVHTQVRSLARQKGRTERHREYTGRRFGIVMTLARRELESFAGRYEELEGRRDFLRQRLPQVRTRLTELEGIREERTQSRIAADARRAELDRRLGEVRIEAERLEGDLKLAGERLQYVQARRERAREERREVEERIDRLGREMEVTVAERQAAREARASVQTELNLRTASEDETRARLQQHRESVRLLEDELQQRAEALRALQGEHAALERELEELQQQSADVTAQVRSASREVAQAHARIHAARAALSTRETEEREAGSVLEHARHTLAAAREHEAAVRVERRDVEGRIARATARRDALEALERKREGVAPAVQALLETALQFGDGAILGPLSDFVTSSRADARLAERLLGDWLQAVLVRDQAAVDAIRHWHETAAPGPLLLLPVGPGPRTDASGAASRFGLVASTPAHRWLDALLAQAEPGDAAGSFIRQANGAVLLPGSGAAGPLSRRAELEELGRSITQLEQRLTDLTSAVEEAAKRHATGERELEAATERHGRARSAVREAQGAVDEAGRMLMRVERELADTQQAAARVAQRVIERERRLQQISEGTGEAQRDRERLAEDLAARQTTLGDLEAQQEAARERRVHWQVEEVQVSAREQAAAEREERARQALADARDTIQRLDLELEAAEGESRELTGQRGDWTDRIADRRVAVQELEEATQAAVEGVQRAETAAADAARQLEEARTEIDQVSEELHRVEIELTEAHGRRQAMIERIQGEWHKPIDVLLEEAADVEGDIESLHAESIRLQDELDRIGPVNLLAVEEHAEELKRLDFLTNQRDDLVAARASLVEALKEIEATARDMFLDTFTAIRENFHSVFLTLFEGGECDLRLAEENDPLGSDIVIHAAPRGKRTQRIHLLSSGERALVAISLLFAIYLTKPAPFCLLDEVDAPLDDANVMRFVRLLDEFKADTQFIVITHNPRTMQVADSVYGVTMQEPGVSTIVGVRLGGEAEQSVA